jgi:hypothetical protein
LPKPSALPFTHLPVHVTFSFDIGFSFQAAQLALFSTCCQRPAANASVAAKLNASSNIIAKLATFAIVQPPNKKAAQRFHQVAYLSSIAVVNQQQRRNWL